MKRFIKNCKTISESRVTSNTLLLDEIKDAQNYWIKQAQVKSFPGKAKDKCLLKFAPQVDKDGLLRVDGQLHLAEELPYDTRHPIILPKSHPVTRLIIMEMHEKLGHGTGTQHLLTELCSKFWVVKGQQMVRTIVRRCPGCRQWFHAKPVEQKMAYSLDTDSLLNAFVRMTARRGTPSYVVSDNGTNFVAGETEMREKVQELDQEKIVKTTTQHQLIEWKFNPQAPLTLEECSREW